jgi:hypothetical protein
MQSLWKIDNFVTGSNNLQPDFLCKVGGISGQLQDVAVLAQGDIVVSALGCQALQRHNLHLL